MIKINEFLPENFHQLEKMAKSKKNFLGISTGFKYFDLLTQGILPGDLMVVAGRTQTGKTSFAFNLMVNLLNEETKPYLCYYSSDMSKDEIGFRLLSLISKIQKRKLYVGRLIEQDWHSLAASAEQLSKSSLYVSTEDHWISSDKIKKSIEEKFEEDKFKLIVIDKFSALTTKGTYPQYLDYDQSQAIIDLKCWARNHNAALVLIQDLGVQIETRPNKRPMFRDLNDPKGTLESYADQIVFLYRDEMYNRESEDKGITEVIVAKNRRGEDDTIRLQWNPEIGLFTNYIEQPLKKD